MTTESRVSAGLDFKGRGQRTEDAVNQQYKYCLFVLDYEITCFVFSFFTCVLVHVLLKGMVESCLLSKYELLTPNVDKVMPV